METDGKEGKKPRERRSWSEVGQKGAEGAWPGSLPAEGPATWWMHSSISISPDSVVVYTLKYYEVQQRERNGMKCSRSLTVTNITRWQNENKKIRID